jgi:soluble lytic murein transglycosylase-like protein
LRLAALPLAALIGLASAPAPAVAASARQQDPELRRVLAAAIAPAECFDDEYERAVWFAYMGPRLARTIKDADERSEILHHVHCEARRVKLPPELVLAVIDVESRFDRYAVSYAGAVGLMQVMPFWPRQLGMSNEQLIRVGDNVRMGTTILGYYLAKERGNLARALQRYNGSLGRSTYSDLVLARLAARWRYQS